MTTTIDPSTLAADLAQFTGTENYYAHWMKRVKFTDGVKYLADAAGAYWLIDLIASWQLKAKVRREEFQIWILTVGNRKRTGNKPMAYARCFPDTPEPKNANQVCVQGIPYTDFPLDEIKLYLRDGVIMLPSEY